MPVNSWTLPSSILILCFSVLYPFLSLRTSAINEQGQALLNWKLSLNGSNEALYNWNPKNENPCGWFGITCNRNREVVEVVLRYVNLPGKLPLNFSPLSSLNRLVLSGVNLTGSIPKEIGGLTQLHTLELSDNGLTGAIPSEICALVNLEQLYLNSNQLEGSILGPVPEEIGNCSSLVILGLAETSISGFLPASLGRLKKLQTLAIYTALLSGQIPHELGDCTELQNIYLYENSLSGSIPSSLGRLKNLQSVLIWQNNLVGVIPPELGWCDQLFVIDLSINSLTGNIPSTFGNLTLLQELQLSTNQLSGEIPKEIGNCLRITHIELDNNQLTGTIPSELGNLTNLTLLFLWQNKLEGSIPPTISNCRNLEALDLSLNALTGSVPTGIFQLKKLSKLLLLSNNLSGVIPPTIGNCSSLFRFRANNNKLAGEIPPEIGNLKKLVFLDLGNNHLTGALPPEISGCRNLTFLDLHSNSLKFLPEEFGHLSSLQYVDLSNNLIEGTPNPSFGSFNSLTKLVLSNNRFSGPIPTEIGSCLKLQLLDLSCNQLSGNIPSSLGKIPSLEIGLNLSLNQLTGEIPSEFANFNKLGSLDLSYNQLSGDLHILTDLQNLVVLNVSHNNFSGRVPETPFFTQLPLSVLSGNPDLCFAGEKCYRDNHSSGGRHTLAARVAMVVLLCTACALLLAAVYIILKDRHSCRRCFNGSRDEDPDAAFDSDLELGSGWEVTLYQKLDLSISDVIKCLTPANVIGRGKTGVVYRACISSGLIIAVKRFRSSDKFSAAAFSSEIATLARIRHRNIVRLLGWGANRRTKLLFYDYLPNGNLGALLHEGNGRVGLDWDSRFKIALGVAEGLAYLHHDCVPAILHRDVKAHNILLGDRYEACLADFGLARLVEDGPSGSSSANPQFAGSYGYFAPEYGCMLRITEKSDVYSYGVVLLEIITGKKPADSSFAEGQHVIQWVRDHLKKKKDPVLILDPKLQGQPDPQIQEILQALGISLLCTSDRSEDRPTMKDVAALLREIQQDQPATAAEAADKPPRKNSNATSFDTTTSFSSSSSTAPASHLLFTLPLQESSRCSYASLSSSGAYIPRKQ